MADFPSIACTLTTIELLSDWVQNSLISFIHKPPSLKLPGAWQKQECTTNKGPVICKQRSP